MAQVPLEIKGDFLLSFHKSLFILLDSVDSPATPELTMESMKHKMIDKIISLLPLAFYSSYL